MSLVHWPVGGSRNLLQSMARAHKLRFYLGGPVTDNQAVPQFIYDIVLICITMLKSTVSLSIFRSFDAAIAYANK